MKLEYNKLFKQYKKRIKVEVKNLFKNKKANYSNGINYFMLNLKFIRDYFILTEPLVIKGQENIKISTLVNAIAAYDNYVSCSKKYYNLDEKGVPHLKKAEGKTSVDTLAQYNEERKYHLHCFWSLLNECLESWGGELA